VLDFARVGPSGFEGESYHVDAEVHGRLDARGFLMDFGPVKKLLKRCVDDVLDHRFAVPRSDPRVRVETVGERIRVSVGEALDYLAPPDAFAFFDADRVGPSEIAWMLRHAVLERTPSNVADVVFSLASEADVAVRPSYRYTHGLKRHEGNCQRLIHGHRNIIEVFVDGAPHREGEEKLAHLFDDVHFVHVEDVHENIAAGVRGSDGEPVEVTYASSQGRFEGKLPRARVLGLDCEPTVENIASFAHRYLVEELNVEEERLEVIAYEGIHKGARVGGTPTK
ncbi:MAG: 6-carboxytetrahydropterin synthase, partial [Myxococcota bacterium]